MKNIQKTTFIYTLYHPITNEVRYIGKSNNPSKRLYKHILDIDKTKSHKNNWIKSLLNEDLKPKVSILDEVPIDEWEYWEKYWIEQFKNWNFRLTNISEGGRGPNGYRHNKKSKKKMRQLKLGTKLSEEHKNKISKSGKKYHKDNPSYNMKGKNIRIYINKNLLYDLYITQNLSMPQISKKLNISEKKIFDNLHHYDIKKEDGWWLSDLSNKYKKPVLQYDLKGNLIKEWDGIVDIKSKLKFNTSNIASCCRGLIKSSNNFIKKLKTHRSLVGGM